MTITWLAQAADIKTMTSRVSHVEESKVSSRQLRENSRIILGTANYELLTVTIDTILRGETVPLVVMY